jgi:hypothetical protein
MAVNNLNPVAIMEDFYRARARARAGFVDLVDIARRHELLNEQFGHPERSGRQLSDAAYHLLHAVCAHLVRPAPTFGFPAVVDTVSKQASLKILPSPLSLSLFFSSVSVFPFLFFTLFSFLSTNLA